MEQHLPEGTSWYLVIVVTGMALGLIVYIWSGLINRVTGHSMAIDEIQGDVREIKTILMFAHPEYKRLNKRKHGKLKQGYAGFMDKD